MKTIPVAAFSLALLILSIPGQAAQDSLPSENVSRFPEEDADQDGLTNQGEAEAGTNPLVADTDGDGVPDGADGWALVPELAPARLARPTYALIEIGSEQSYGKEINNSGVALIWSRGGNWLIWHHGGTSPVGNPPSRVVEAVYGLSEEGRVLASTLGNDQFSTGPARVEAWVLSGMNEWSECYEPQSLEEVAQSMEQYVCYHSVHADSIGPDGAVYGYASLSALTPGYAMVSGAFRWKANSVDRLGDQIGYGYGSHSLGLAYSYTPDISPLSNLSVPTEYLSDGSSYHRVAVNQNNVSASIRSTIDGLFYAWDWDRNYIASGGSQTYILDVGFGQIQLFDFGGQDPGGHQFAISNRNTVALKFSSGETTLWLDSKGGLRNEQPVDGSPNFSRVDWVPSFGETPPVQLDAKMRGFSGPRIWQNARWHDLTALVPSMQGSGASWSNFSAADQNDRGVLIGTAVKAADQAQHAVLLVPFEVVSDLNNNGKIDGGDRTRKSDGAKPDATDEQKEKATEYLFANDNVSNGAWDKDDPSPDKPQHAEDDDDAEELSVTCAATWGAVWFEHPAIEKLSFYKTKECLPADKVTFPFALSDQESGKLPEKLYVRLDGPDFIAQTEGDLVMKFGKADKSETWAEDKLKFTAIKQFGDEKFFQAARDYIFEHNSRLFVHDWGYPISSPSTWIRMCVMREEATTMNPFESYHDDAYFNYLASNSPPGTPFHPDIYTSYGFGIDGAISADHEMTVVINGNQCDFTNPSLPDPRTEAGRLARLAILTFDAGLDDPWLTDKCHGRVIINGALNAASSDHYDETTLVAGTSMRGSPLAGPDPIPGTSNPGGKYIAQYEDGHFGMGTGQVPASGLVNAMGGLSGSYSSSDRSNYPNSFVGFAPLADDGKGAVFVAMGKGSQGNGRVREFYDAAKSSEVPEISGATASSGLATINLAMLDSGDTSCAMAHKTPADTFKMVYKGNKHDGFPYYTSTFLRFKSEKPRDGVTQ